MGEAKKRSPLTVCESKEKRRLIALCCVALSLLGACTLEYQPLVGFSDSTLARLSGRALSGTRLRLDCREGEGLSAEDADQLCRRVGRLFENQGARLVEEEREEESQASGEEETSRDGVKESGGETRSADTAQTLLVQFRHRELHREETNYLFWQPVSEYLFEQEVSVYNEQGALLARKRLVARFRNQLTFNPFEESTAEARFSQDFYQQLSQLLLNAKQREISIRDLSPPLNRSAAAEEAG